MWAHVLSILLITPIVAGTLSSRRKRASGALAQCKAKLAQTEHQRHVLELIARGTSCKQVMLLKNSAAKGALEWFDSPG